MGACTAAVADHSPAEGSAGTGSADRVRSAGPAARNLAAFPVEGFAGTDSADREYFVAPAAGVYRKVVCDPAGHTRCTRAAAEGYRSSSVLVSRG